MELKQITIISTRFINKELINLFFKVEENVFAENITIEISNEKQRFLPFSYKIFKYNSVFLCAFSVSLCVINFINF